MTDQPYVFITDSDSDLPYDIAEKRNIPVIKMPFSMNGVEYLDENGREGEEKQKEFYRQMREGAVPVTSCLSRINYEEFFEPFLQAGKDIFYIAFSSNMSATLNYAREAWEDLRTRYPGRKLLISDTLSISAPMTLLIEKAHDLYLQGATMEEVDKWVQENRLKAQCWMTVSDLVYLKRGGRLSPTSAFFGTMLDIKPIIVMGREGKMDAAEKTKGRKKAMQVMLERTLANLDDPAGKTIRIMHADCLEDAQALAEKLSQKLQEYENVDIRIQMIGPVIGSHAGPGAIAIAFLGKERPI